MDDERSDALADDVSAKVEIPVDARPRVRRILATKYTFEGPIPPPEMLAAYDKFVPGLAKTIVANLIEEGSHRRSIEMSYVESDRRLVDSEIWLRKAGLITGATLILAGFGVALGFASMAYPWLAGAITIVDLIGLGALFVNAGRRPAPPTLPTDHAVLPDTTDDSPAKKASDGT